MLGCAAHGLPYEWRQPQLARRVELALAVRAEVARLLHESQQAKQLRGAAEALVQLLG